MPLIAYSISPFIKADTDRGTLKNTNNYNEEISTFSNSENNGEKYAFNPETGEINWEDYQTNSIVAHGPCGKEFKDAFSCFVYSKEEPKGMECIKKFQAMQECFKKYPEIYNNGNLSFHYCFFLNAIKEISNEDDIEITESNDL
ncbi:mitochondrial intermembrane space import and assembly protein 40 [Pneumocystis murina B123]|uniref:Mitochondrial intermembrane space import and assembly protein 40 n=1 Tax=Pneumocystis murina (strain B123) TaxID=1069680 RepID=M7PEE3_PNEMU|nr:mitochondrial intermembrane space import and assembly protein 40 [Pneumocystis murina B123]EMR08829.1 mitochondrial intermembrane space import and assembly protein 40 [Pneumocystis murina B123]